MSRFAIWTVNGALFVLCCFLTASLVNGWLGALLTVLPAAYPTAPAAEPPIARSWTDRQVILQRNLFQASTLLPAESAAEQAAALEEQLEATRLPLKLLGTVASSDPDEAWAAVEDTQASRRQVVRPQDRLLDKATVVRIERRRIVLENGGRREELALDDEEIPPGLAVGIVSPAPPAAGDNLRERIRRLADDRFQVERSEVQRAMRNPGEIFTQARILPKYENGEMLGVQLSAIQPGSLFEQIGIRDGDIIQSVNGIEVSSPQGSTQVVQELAQAERLEVEVLGSDGQSRRLSYVVQP